MLKGDSNELPRIEDSVMSGGTGISSISVYAKDTHIYVPSSRYYAVMKGSPIQKTFYPPVSKVEIGWKIGGDAEPEFKVN